MARTRCEVWSRVVGFLRPTARWNEGKLAEFKDRKMFKEKKEDQKNDSDKNKEEEWLMENEGVIIWRLQDYRK